ncbi:protein ALP1-like [Ziziphus jujuba]|uniref:Protein ALP1-like n=1 Tax=Ziziphus jujuba TaxID=326968 RepID=A0ABM4A7U9_ZIZJJ|nr:protein ALP1-like [Ziziphus jujuba]
MCPVSRIIRNEGDKTDPPKHLGHFCPALFPCFQPASHTRSPLLFDLKPFLTSKTFEAITTSTPATVKANPNSAAGETHFNQIVFPKPAFSPNSVKRHRLVRRIDRRAPIWNPHPFYRRQESSLKSQPKCRPENWVLCLICHSWQRKNERRVRNRITRNTELRTSFIDSLLDNDVTCISQLRMDRRTFVILCRLLRQDGYMKRDGTVTLEEQVCIFLHIIAYHTKNRTIISRFYRSGETISRYFNSVLNGVLRLHSILLRHPEPVSDNCSDDRWKMFKNCLGALDGTYIKVKVPEINKPRYRTRKGEIATNVLGVCNPNMEFIFVLPGWEGSASDSRVLRDAISRPNGLKVPTGCYYLVDAGYTNGEGFLAPYRGTRYHLSEWRDGCAPINHQEYFNMKHASARNIIERCFGVLKMRWAILRSPSFYPIATQIKIITACCLIHNLIRR